MKIDREYNFDSRVSYLPASFVYWPEGFTLEHILMSAFYLLVMIGLIFYAKSARKKSLAAKPKNQQEDFINGILLTLQEERIPIEGHVIIKGRAGFWDIKAKLIDIGKNYLMLETNIATDDEVHHSQVEYPKEIKNKRFRASFELGNKVYEFTVNTVDYKNINNKIYLKISIPQQLELTFTRHHKRLEIDSKIKQSAVLFPRKDNTYLPEQLDELLESPIQRLTCMPNALEELSIINISPKGLKIKANTENLFKKNINFEKKATCFLALSLVQFNSQETLKLLLLLECKHVERHKGYVTAGFFILKYVAKQDGYIRWMSNDRESGVDEIQLWVNSVTKNEEESS